MIFSVPTWTNLLSMQNMPDKRKFSLRCLLTVYCAPCVRLTLYRKSPTQKRNYGATVPISTFMCLWAVYIFPRSICLFCCRIKFGQILGICKSLTDTWMWKLGRRLRNSTEMEYINGIFVAVHKSRRNASTYKRIGRGREKMTGCLMLCLYTTTLWLYRPENALTISARIW